MKRKKRWRKVKLENVIIDRSADCRLSGVYDIQIPEMPIVVYWLDEETSKRKRKSLDNLEN